MEKLQAERAKQYEQELEDMNKELEALRRRVRNIVMLRGEGESLCVTLEFLAGLDTLFIVCTKFAFILIRTHLIKYLGELIVW